MDGDDQLTTFAAWLRKLAKQAGFDPDSRGGIANLAKASGTDRGQTSRAMRGEVRPSIDSLRAWTSVFRDRRVDVEFADMLVRSGTLRPEDLPDPDEAPPPPTSEMDLYAVARNLGVPPEQADLFVRSVEAVAKTFADGSNGTTISGSRQTGRLSAEG